MAPSSAARLEAPAERLAAKDQAVHGFGGGQQVTTMLSVPIAKAPLMPPTATTLSAHHIKHDSKSTHMEERSAKRPALRSKGRSKASALHTRNVLVSSPTLVSKSETCFL